MKSEYMDYRLYDMKNQLANSQWSNINQLLKTQTGKDQLFDGKCYTLVWCLVFRDAVYT